MAQYMGETYRDEWSKQLMPLLRNLNRWIELDGNQEKVFRLKTSVEFHDYPFFSEQGWFKRLDLISQE